MFFDILQAELEQVYIFKITLSKNQMKFFKKSLNLVYEIFSLQ